MKLRWLVIVLLLMSSLLAQSEEKIQPVDYTNQEILNSLTPQDLGQAIKDGYVTDLTAISDINLASALNSDPTLLNYEKVFSTFNTRVQSNPQLLNNNPGVKGKWFEHFGIGDNGAQIDSFDGTKAVLASVRGEIGVTIANINDKGKLEGAIVTEDGALILKNNVLIAEGAIVSFVGGTLIVEGGFVDLSESATVSGKFEGGIIRNGDRIYTSDSELEIVVNSKGIIISGENVEERDEINEQIAAKFTGQVSILEKGGKLLNKGTEYSAYEDNQEQKKFTVKEPTQYVMIGEDCNQFSSCIEDRGDSLIIFAKDDNGIEIKLNSYLKELKVQEILGIGRVTIQDKNNLPIILKRDDFNIEGDPSSLAIGRIETSLVIESDVKEVTISNGKVIVAVADEGKLLGSIYRRRYIGFAENIDGSETFTKNIYTAGVVEEEGSQIVIESDFFGERGAKADTEGASESEYSRISLDSTIRISQSKERLEPKETRIYRVQKFPDLDRQGLIAGALADAAEEESTHLIGGQEMERVEIRTPTIYEESVKAYSLTTSSAAIPIHSYAVVSGPEVGIPTRGAINEELSEDDYLYVRITFGEIK